MSQSEEKHQQVKERIINEVNQDERYTEFFDQYAPSSIAYFISRYAYYKAQLEVYGDYTIIQQKSLLDQWQKCAWNCLEEIQNKKLLDLACLWHAEEVKNLPDIEISIDFTDVQSYILDYPALPDITVEEIEFFIQFLRTNEHVVNFVPWSSGFSIFNWIKDAYIQHGNTGNQYYDYHNIYTGHHSYFNFPNIRDDKEQKYLQLGLELEQKKNKAMQEVSLKPYLKSTKDEMIKFARQFKDFKTAHFIRDYEIWQHQKNDFSVRFALDYLNDLHPEKVPIKAHTQWQDAVYDSAITHLQSKVMEILPSVYQEYMMKKQTGLFISSEKDRNKYNEVNDWYKKLIFDGREALGEPRDLNF